MSSASAIRAGAAYVEVFLEQNAVTRGLSALQSRLRGWSASLGRIGAGAYGGQLPGPLGAIANFASSPAGMFAGLLTAAKMASNSGDEMVHLAEKAGTSVEAISSLAYAARRADVNSDSLATSIKKMQVNIVAAARGGKEAKEALDAIGMTAEELGRLLPEEQFRRIADRIAAIQNPAERATAAVKIFGRNGTDLLPLLLQGSEGIGKWEARARALGLVMNSEAAEGAHRFSLLLGDLHDVLMSGVKVIGGAIIPELTRFVNWIVQGTIAARDWIKEHKGILVTALQVTGAIVAGGLAFSVVAGILRNAASAISLVLIPLRLLSGLASGLVGLSASIAAGVAGAAWSAAAMVAHAAWAGLGLLGSGLGLVFSAAAGIASLVWTGVAAVAGVAWSLASLVASAAWVAGSVVVSAAWSVLSAVPAVLAAAWSAAAAIASAAWTAVAVALDTVLTFAMTGAMALPFAIIAAIVAGIAFLGAAIYVQLSSAFSSAPEIGKKAGQEITNAAVDGAKNAGGEIGAGIGAGVVNGLYDAIRGVGQVASFIGSAFRNAINNLAANLSELWRGVSSDAIATFGLIGQALMTGNMTKAWPVITAFAKLEWARISLFAQQAFSGLLDWWAENKNRLIDPIMGMAETITKIFNRLKDEVESLANLYHAVFGWSTSMRQDRFSDFKQKFKDDTSGMSSADKLSSIDNWIAEDEAYVERMKKKYKGHLDDPGIAAMLDEENDKQAWIREQRDRISKDVPQKPADGKGAADPFAEQRKAVEKAKKELEEARNALSGQIANSQAERGKTLPTGHRDVPDIGNLPEAKSKVAGTFSSYALGGLGGGGEDVQKKMESHLARMNDKMDRTNAALERVERQMNQGQLLA